MLLHCRPSQQMVQCLDSDYFGFGTIIKKRLLSSFPSIIVTTDRPGAFPIAYSLAFPRMSITVKSSIRIDFKRLTSDAGPPASDKAQPAEP
jgi:hypothetical protein